MIAKPTSVHPARRIVKSVKKGTHAQRAESNSFWRKENVTHVMKVLSSTRVIRNALHVLQIV